MNIHVLYYFQNYAAAEHTAKSTFESSQSTYTGSSSTLSSDYGFSYASAVIKSDTGKTQTYLLKVLLSVYFQIHLV